MRILALAISLISVGLFYGCVSVPPSNVNDLCALFEEKPRWYRQVSDAAQRWNSTIPIIMSIIHQESRFVQGAKPPRRKILWVIPGPRLSDAYGYAQARDSTWEWYLEDTERWNASRRDFGDAVDFVGWYNNMSHRLANISRRDPYNLYLAYHDGQGGFNRRTYASKGWLLKVAKRVEHRANRYRAQLQRCEGKLKRRGWWPF